MSVNRNDVYMFLFENMSASTDAVATEFEIDLSDADSMLQEMADDSDAIVGKNDVWRVRDWDDIPDDDAAQSIARDAFGSPSVPEDATRKVASVTPTDVGLIPQNRSEGILERARENFGELAQSAPTESGRRFWQAKLDTLPAS